MYCANEPLNPSNCNQSQLIQEIEDIKTDTDSLASLLQLLEDAWRSDVVALDDEPANCLTAMTKLAHKLAERIDRAHQRAVNSNMHGNA